MLAQSGVVLEYGVQEGCSAWPHGPARACSTDAGRKGYGLGDTGLRAHTDRHTACLYMARAHEAMYSNPCACHIQGQLCATLFFRLCADAHHIVFVLCVCV